MKMTRNIFLVFCLLVMITGCVRTVDPATGETQTTLDPAVDKKIVAVGEAVEKFGPPAAGVSYAIHPAVGVIATGVVSILIGIFGTYKKMRPQILAADSNYDRAILGLRAAAGVIETSVKPNKDLWESRGGGKEIMLKAEAAGAINPDTV